MANVYSGNHLKAQYVHSLDSKDAVLAGPSDWSLLGTSGSFGTTAKFGSALSIPSGDGRLDSDSGLGSFNNLDTAKYIYHCWLRIDNHSVPAIRRILQLGPSGHGTFMASLAWATDTDRILMQHKTVAGTIIEPEAKTLVPHIPLDTYVSIVGFMDVPGGTGDIYINGINRRDGVNNPVIASMANVSNPFVRIGNGIGASPSDPVGLVDHPSLIQDVAFNTSSVAFLVALYKEVRGFGFRPTITSIFIDTGDPTKVIIIGTGFGPDAFVKLDNILTTNTVVLGDGQISVTPPIGVSVNVTIEVQNAASGVIVTESALTMPFGGPPSNPSNPTQATNSQNPPLQNLGPIPLSAAGLPPTIWTENGLSNRRIMAGDNLTPEMRLRANDPLPVYHPRVMHTVWTQTQPVNPAP